MEGIQFTIWNKSRAKDFWLKIWKMERYCKEGLGMSDCPPCFRPKKGD